MAGQFQKERFGIKAKLISEVSGDVRAETVLSWKEKLPEILKGWTPQDIWKMEMISFSEPILTDRWLKDLRIAPREKETHVCVGNAFGGKEKPPCNAVTSIKSYVDSFGDL